ncbi:MAG TPA: LysR family transcriptional regulator [Oceanospirillales bacterium]|nr:LysR family transcriptional regulator [Oleispira sp.]HCM06244.1 LysR family transcriptional regulator [Oceanospirillales bacterium]|tara:strand:+ start:1118 stop:1999 length:882 start_codon:yes stop_codon:yes gene_type:complete
MQWQGICEFTAVAESGNFTQAAKKLLISTAQVSRQVSELEQRLNTKLFYRTTRKVTLTEEGQLFYQQCRGILDRLENAERSLTNLQSTPQGKIKISAPVTYGERHIIPLINQFLIQYPQVEIEVQLSNQRINLIEEGYDLAIRLGQLDDSSLIAKRISSRQHFLCASPSYIEQHGKPEIINDLKHHNCLLGSADFWLFSDPKSKDQQSDKKIRVTGSLRCNSGLGLVDAALKGIGIVQLPEYYISEHINKGELITLLEQQQREQEGIWALYPQNKYLASKVRLLIDFLQDNLN